MGKKFAKDDTNGKKSSDIINSVAVYQLDAGVDRPTVNTGRH